MHNALVFWGLYRSPLTGLQWAGIALTVVGTVLATWSGAAKEPPPASGRPTGTEAA